jgi:hypothetical protein
MARSAPLSRSSCSTSTYRGTSPIRKRLPLGSYGRAMPRALRWSLGGRRFLVSEGPLYVQKQLSHKLTYHVRGTNPLTFERSSCSTSPYERGTSTYGNGLLASSEETSVLADHDCGVCGHRAARKAAEYELLEKGRLRVAEPAVSERL